MIVGGASSIARSMSELDLNVFVGVALFMQNRGSSSPESVPCHPSLVSHAFKPFEDNVVAHRGRFGFRSPGASHSLPTEIMLRAVN